MGGKTRLNKNKNHLHPQCDVTHLFDHPLGRTDVTVVVLLREDNAVAWAIYSVLREKELSKLRPHMVILPGLNALTEACLLFGKSEVEETKTQN
ncbi:hypothetical protein NPIL_450431 [Nephila pilipes]|uniref:Uncharacterized protein n=1 Tax=Nephila pilipes TaxID=299642 RepID=A0A8X6TI26_NEPPI|nr:hypothetical protein NPIL_450431 [Nephila pilipes]